MNASRVDALKRRMTEGLVAAVPQGVVSAGLDVLRRLPVNRGRSVYEREWDVLVVLDACRLDMYREVVGPCEPLTSVASTSTVWLERTFADEHADEIARTGYVSANPYSHQLDATRFGLIDHVWRDAWDDDLGTIPAGPITDHAVAVGRRDEFDRVVVHYMQPHFPFVADGEPAFGRLGRSGFGLGEDDDSRNVWQMAADGEVDRDDVIAAYYDNLRYVFEHVERLLANVDGTVAITADHGNALGEWGMWGHRAYVPSDALRKVPWDVRECTDSRTFEPDVDLNTSAGAGEEAVGERLRALGYVEE